MKRFVKKVKDKVFSKKTKIKFDTKSDVFFEDNASKNSKFQIIFDKEEPFYKHTFPKEEKWQKHTL